MRTSFLFAGVGALAYADCASANFRGFMNLPGSGYARHVQVSGDKSCRFGLFDGTSVLHAGTVRAAGAC